MLLLLLLLINIVINYYYYACVGAFLWKGMSCQCWCFTCGGRVVARSTFNRHGRKDRPDAPLRKQAVVMHSLEQVGEDMDVKEDLHAPDVDEGREPAPRTHSSFVNDAVANETHRGWKKDAPYKRTGVKELSPLAALPMFNLVWDVLPDMMHVIPGIWKRHVFAMFNGDRLPAKPRPRKSLSAADNAKLMADHAAAVAHLAEWSLAPEEREMLDQRSMDLGGEPKWIRSNIMICSHTSTLTAHDWMLLIQTAGHYLLHGLFEDVPEKMQCMLRLLNACNKCLTVTSAWDSENREEIDAVKLEVAEALAFVEAHMPRTELPVMFHVLLHVPDAIYRWNSVRNFWSFFSERYILCSMSVSIACRFYLLLMLTSCNHAFYCCFTCLHPVISRFFLKYCLHPVIMLVIVVPPACIL